MKLPPGKILVSGVVSGLKVTSRHLNLLTCRAGAMVIAAEPGRARQDR
jgi:hypothetical protein